MKRKTLEKKKFNLEKFEVAKLFNMKSIKGGDSEGGPITAGTDVRTLSTNGCKTLSTSISDTNPNTIGN